MITKIKSAWLRKKFNSKVRKSEVLFEYHRLGQDLFVKRNDDSETDYVDTVVITKEHTMFGNYFKANANGVCFKCTSYDDALSRAFNTMMTQSMGYTRLVERIKNGEFLQVTVKDNKKIINDGKDLESLYK